MAKCTSNRVNIICNIFDYSLSELYGTTLRSIFFYLTCVLLFLALRCSVWTTRMSEVECLLRIFALLIWT